MVYQVLARKYRPQFFSEVVGQEHITTTLKNALAGGRIHHAYLFTGARGIGKTTVARILAKSLNCENRKGDEPCSNCVACNEITNGSSMDVQEIDGASNTGVDDVREIRERLKFMPSHGRYRIYIIDEVHMLSNNAFNALLKTLEEPPAHVVFIFATTEVHKIPATILSRCQRYDFRRIPGANIADTIKRIALTEGSSIDDDAIKLIAHEAMGSLRDAESLFDQSIAFAAGNVTSDTIRGMLGFLDRKRLFDLMSCVAHKDATGALAILDEIFETGADLSRFANDVLEMVRNMLVMAECGEGRGLTDLSADEALILKGIAADLPAATLHQIFASWYSVAEGISRSSFPKMLLEIGLIRLCRIGDMKQLSEIVAKLDLAIAGSPQTVPGRAASVQQPARDVVKSTAPVANTPAEKSVDPKVASPAAPLEIKLQAVAESKPAFEAAMATKDDLEGEKRWQEFMRWLAVQRPQVASLLGHGTLEGIEGDVVDILFANPIYADMLSEDDRKQQVESFFAAFFKRPMRLNVTVSDNVKAKGAQNKARDDRVREALGSDIVRQAADILGAELHEVKLESK